MSKRSLKQEILTALKKSGNTTCHFTSVEMADTLDYHKVVYTKRSLSAMLSTLVKRRWLSKIGTRPVNKGRGLVIYAWKGKKYDLPMLEIKKQSGPSSTITTTTETVGNVSRTVTKHDKKHDSNDLDYADIGRALVENVFEMRKMLKEQGKELAKIKLELQERIAQCKDANNTISHRNRQIEELQRKADLLHSWQQRTANKDTGSFKLSEIATIKG